MSALNELPAIKVDISDNECMQEPESIKRQIVNILEQMNRFKERVSKYIDDNYNEFLPNNSSVYMHLEEGKHLEKDSSDLLMSLQWAFSSAELKPTVETLKHSVYDLQMINRILAADEIFQHIDEANSNKDYIVTLDLLKKLNALLKHNPRSEAQAILHANPCYDTIRIKYLSQMHRVKTNIKEKFQRLFKFSEKQLPHLVCSTIQVSKDTNQLQDTVVALFQAQYDVSNLSDFLLDKCLVPIITKPVSVSFSEECSEYMKLQISYAPSNTEKCDYIHVFENIKLLFNCLETINVLVSDQQYVFAIIGDHIKDKFIKLLIDECIMESIPASLADYQISTLVQDTLQFEHHLADLFFINKEEERSLSKFTDRFEILFKNNLYRCLLDSGREIMQKDLQDMILVAEKNDPEDVANNPMLYPKSMVSKSVMDFIKLLNRILRQDSENPEDDSLHGIIMVLINSYMNLVPQFHKEPLELLPQPAMLFHNNCNFINHWMAKKMFGIPTAASIANNLSATGSKYLNNQISKQLIVLKNVLNIEHESSSEINVIPIAIVRKCLVHLKLLESLWQHVLPYKIYNQTMGKLVSSCSCIISQNVLAKESLSSVERKQITELLHLFKSQAESLFKDPSELQYFKDWIRLVNLSKMLEASLPEISEIWCTGNLAEYFKADEVIHLIRSIHPDTERRSLCLKKIY